LFALVWVYLSMGGVPLPQIAELTNLIGRLAVRMEQAIADINALSVQQLRRELSA
jgi:hypothetical protein